MAKTSTSILLFFAFLFVSYGIAHSRFDSYRPVAFMNIIGAHITEGTAHEYLAFFPI